MYLFDTDHLTIMDRGGSSAQILLAKLSQVNPNEIATTIAVKPRMNPLQVENALTKFEYRDIDSDLSHSS